MKMIHCFPMITKITCVIISINIHAKYHFKNSFNLSLFSDRSLTVDLERAVDLFILRVNLMEGGSSIQVFPSLWFLAHRVITQDYIVLPTVKRYLL